MQSFEIFNQLEIHPFSTSNNRSKYLICFEGRYFEVGESVAKLAEALKISNSLAETALHYQESSKKKYSENEIEVLIEKCISPIMQSHKTPKTTPLIFKFELVSKKTVDVFSNILKILFNTKIIIVISIAFIALECLFLTDSLDVINIYDIDLYSIGGILLLYLCSSIFHELGHASACKYFKTDHGGIGFGLYLNFPVFYTDVSGIWKLSRKKRLIINMAGVYFQLIFLIPLFSIYFYTYDNVLKYFILAININILITLNPFFKFDGYWIVSDLLGVPNLRKRTHEFFNYLIKKIRKQPINNKPFFMTIKNREKIFMVVYCVVVNLFFMLYFLYIIPKFLFQFFQTYPSVLKEFVYQLSTGQAIDYKLLQIVSTQLVFFLLIIFILVRTLSPFFKKKKKFPTE